MTNKECGYTNWRKEWAAETRGETLFFALKWERICLLRMKGEDAGLEVEVAIFYILGCAQAAAFWLSEERN